MNPKLFIFFQKIAPQQLLSRLFGRFADCTFSPLKSFIIKKFIAQYKVNMHEAINSDAESYTNFNHFFTRELKPGSRPIDASKASIVSPADGVISAIGDINKGQLIQAKGKYFSLQNLLGGKLKWTQTFEGGKFATIYLSPKDYHRVHMPASGKLIEMIYIPGKLFSVNQTTSENISGLFALNERVICFFETEIGPMAVILVGAMIVAGIETTWEGHIAPNKNSLFCKKYLSEKENIQIDKGMEMGRFKLGSTAIVLFARDKMTWSDNCTSNKAIQMGQHLGCFNS